MAARLRFDRSARHGAALVGIAFAAYLTIATDFSTIVQAADYAGTIPNDVPVVNAVQFATIVAVFLVSFALIATTPMRRAVTLTLVPLALFAWAYLGVLAGSGVLPLGDAAAWAVVRDQGFVTLVVVLGGWLIARGLHAVSWVVLLLALLPPLAGVPLGAWEADSITYALVIQGIVLVAAIGGAALAFAIDRAVRGDRAVPPTRFDAPTRYGVALALVVVATYLGIATDFTGYLDEVHYGGAASGIVLGMLQFVLVLALYVAGFVVMPTGSARRLGAVTLACVVLLLWATLGIERSVGNVSRPAELWFVLLNQGFVTLVVTLGGWLLVRGRHPVAFVVMALAIVPPLVARALVNASVTSGAYTLVMEAVVALGGIVGGGIAWVIDAVARQHEPRPATAPRAPRSPHAPPLRPAAVTAVAVVVWIDGSVQMLTGIFDLGGQGVSGEAARASAFGEAVVTISIGLATVLVGAGLLQGRRAARVVATVFLAIGVLNGAFDILGGVLEGDAVGIVVGGFIAGLNALAIVLLWARRAGAFFGRARTPAPASP